MYVDIGARSDKRHVRTRNEDCYCVRPQEGLLVVADGMGDHASGEIASSIAVEALTTHCLQLNTGLPTPFFRAPHQELLRKRPAWSARLIARTARFTWLRRMIVQISGWAPPWWLFGWRVIA